MINSFNNLFSFQEECVTSLLDTVGDQSKKPTIIVKSPTGSGKTIMMIEFINQYLDVYPNTCFIWFSPGKGDLEEQSKEKMDRLLPNRDTADIHDVLLRGFEPKETVFINWERVTKKGNKAITEGEQKNLFEHIHKAKRNKINFVIIIDEEHQNNTSKAKDVIEAFEASNTIRLSATANKSPHAEWYEIPEEEVINSGLITQAMFINDGVSREQTYDVNTEYQVLIDLAENKRQNIRNEYIKIKRNIKPLVIIQFPSDSDNLIEAVEQYLEEIGVNYKNGLLAKWLAEEKINIENIEENNARPEYLLMKQAISTGWDCPRAKILIKLRSNMDENFEIQTLGRLRRMPEAKHYENTLLDYCFLYTFDDKYKQKAMSEGNSYEVRRVFLKSKAKTFQLTKEYRDQDLDIVGEKETLEAAYNYLANKYHLTTDKKENKRKLETYGFLFGTTLRSTFIQGEFKTITDLQEASTQKNETVRFEVDTHKNGIDLLHSIDMIKKVTGLTQNKAKAILRHLFFIKPTSKYKFVSLGLREWYAFVINNAEKLRDDFRELTTKLNKNIPLPIPKKGNFVIPEEEIYRVDSTEKNATVFLTNVYKNYDRSMINSPFRSRPERLFEYYCENNSNIEWIYKNGDKGQQYFSIVYVTGIGKQYLFYPDYIIKTKDDRTVIIETKGGETVHKNATTNNNIDIQIENKFRAFKEYAKDHNLEWAFVRDKNETLYFNNTKYSDSMNDSQWQPLKYLF